MRSPRRWSARCRPATEAPPRERLRWEKELLGLYLSDHPLGDGRRADRPLRDRLLRRPRTRSWTGSASWSAASSRACGRVITKAKATMGVATLEDLQGTIEVVVFPRTFEATAPIWQEDSILSGGRAGGSQGRRLRDSRRLGMDVGGGRGAGPRGFRQPGAGERARTARRPRRREVGRVELGGQSGSQRLGKPQFAVAARRVGDRTRGRVYRIAGSG